VQLWGLLVFLLNKVVNKVASLCRGFFDSCKRDKLGKGVGSHVTLWALIVAGMLLEEAIENFDAVKFFIRVVALLNLMEESNAHSAILDNSVDKSKRPTDEISVTADQTDNAEERSEQGLDSSIVLRSIEEVSLLFVGLALDEVSDRST